MLTDEQVKFYHENGYLGLENVVPMAQIEEARRVVDELVEQSRTVTDHTAVYDLEPEHTAERPLLRRIKAPDQGPPVLRSVDALRRHSRLP